MDGIIHTYQFGRLSVIGAIPDNKESFIMAALSAPVHLEKRQFRYMISNEKILTYQNHRFAYGELVKYKALLEGEVINENTKQIDIGGLPYGIVATSKFFIHFNSQIISFRPIKSRISDRQFKEYFPDLLEAGYHNFFVSAEIDSVDEDIKIVESIKLLKRVSRIFFSVRPTNPSNRPIYRKLDERLKRLEAEREQRTIIATEAGFNIDELLYDEVYMGIIQAADGYGRASVYGEKEDGTSAVIHTSDSPVIEKVADNVEPLAILAQLFQTFKRIWQRKYEDEQEST